MTETSFVSSLAFFYCSIAALILLWIWRSIKHDEAKEQQQEQPDDLEFITLVVDRIPVRIYRDEQVTSELLKTKTLIESTERLMHFNNGSWKDVDKLEYNLNDRKFHLDTIERESSLVIDNFYWIPLSMRWWW